MCGHTHHDTRPHPPFQLQPKGRGFCQAAQKIQPQNPPGLPAVWTPTYHLDSAGVLTGPTLGPEPLLYFLSFPLPLFLSLYLSHIFFYPSSSGHYQLSHVLSIPFYKSLPPSHALCIPCPFFLFLLFSLSLSFNFILLPKQNLGRVLLTSRSGCCSPLAARRSLVYNNVYSDKLHSVPASGCHKVSLSSLRS